MNLFLLPANSVAQLAESLRYKSEDPAPSFLDEVQGGSNVTGTECV
jgi:hypothetical protein